MGQPESQKTEELKAKVGSTRYFWHSPIDLGDGVVTREPKVAKRFARRLKLMRIPQDLSGKTVLDIGAWDGFFSFEFERRGAKRVLAIDSFAWDKGGIDCFLLAKERLQSKVEHQRLDVHDLSPEAVGTFDLVFFAGVLYHLRHPMLALDKISAVANELLICETHALIPAVHGRWPLMTFFPGDEHTTRLWQICGYPTLSWLREALTHAGFSDVQFRYTPSFYWAKKLWALLTNRPRSGRCIVHARK